MKMKLKEEGFPSISDVWWRFDMSESVVNIAFFILSMIIYPFAWTYVNIRKVFSKIKSK